MFDKAILTQRSMVQRGRWFTKRKSVCAMTDLRWAVRSSSVMHAPLGNLSSGILAVTSLLPLKYMCLTGCLQQKTPSVTFRPSNSQTFLVCLLKPLYASLSIPDSLGHFFICSKIKRRILPVVHLPQFGPHSHLPHTHQSFSSTAHNLPVIRLHRGDAQVVAVQRHHRGASSQVKHSHSEIENKYRCASYRVFYCWQT